MVGRLNSASPTRTAPDGVDEPLLQSDRSAAVAAATSSPGLEGSSDAPETSTSDTGVQGSSRVRRRRSQQSSGASSDLELNEMGRPDMLYVSAGEVSEDKIKVDPSRDWEGNNHNDPRADIDGDREARRLGSKHFVEKTLINAVLIALWYLLSISMSVYNKWMFSPGNLDFHYPLFTTSVHMIVQLLLASLVLFFFPRLRPTNAALDPHDDEDTEVARAPKEPVDPSKPIMTPWFYLTRIVSCGSVTGLDIGLGNTSLKFISLTFFTMCKSSTLGFVLGFAILFRLERPSWKIGGIIAVMTVGVVMMVAGETAFDALGFVLLMLASFFSGLRWSLTQILLRRTPATSNPFSTLFFLTPVMFVILFILAIPIEGFPALKEGLDHLAAQKGLPLGIGIVLFPGCIAFCMTSAEFALLKRTSVVTLSVCGIFKEVLTITAAGFIFGDELTPINISGLLITIMAIAVYNVTRMKKMRRQEINKAQDRWNEERSPMLNPGDRGVAGDTMPNSGRQDPDAANGGLATELVPSGPPLPAALMKRRDYEEIPQAER